MAWYFSYVGITVIAVILYKLIDWIRKRIYVGNYGSRYILITGCDTGFGNMISKRLDKLGCNVFAGCLTEAGASELQSTCSKRLQTVSLDVSKPESVRKAFEIVKSKLPPGKGLWAVLNNAGILGHMGPPDWLTVDSYKNIMQVNLFGLIDVTMTFLSLVKQEQGRVVNMASVAGRISIAELLPYCTSKFGVEAFTDGLRRAMYPFNIKVIVVEPGWHKTPITSRENLVPLMTKSWNQATPEVQATYGDEYFKYCCDDFFSALDRTGSVHPEHVVDVYEECLLARYPKTRYAVGNDARFIFLPLQSFPEWISDWLLFKSDPKKPLPAALKKKLNNNNSKKD